MIRIVLESYLRGCIVGNLIDAYNDANEGRAISLEVFDHIFKGEEIYSYLNRSRIAP